MRTQIRTFILLFNAYLGPHGPHGALGPAKSWAPWVPWALGPAKSWAPWAPWGLGPAKSWAPWAHGALGPAWDPQLAAWARPGALSRRRGAGLGPSAGGGPGPAWGPQSIRRNPHQKITFWICLGKHMTKKHIFGAFGVNICDVLMKS